MLATKCTKNTKTVIGWK